MRKLSIYTNRFHQIIEVLRLHQQLNRKLSQKHSTHVDSLLKTWKLKAWKSAFQSKESIAGEEVWIRWYRCSEFVQCSWVELPMEFRSTERGAHCSERGIACAQLSHSITEALLEFWIQKSSFKCKSLHLRLAKTPSTLDHERNNVSVQVERAFSKWISEQATNLFIISKTQQLIEIPTFLFPQKKRNSERDIWRNSWGSNHSQKSSCSLQSNFTSNYIGKDDFWLALQPNYNFIMDTKLLDTCREARGELEHSRREETNHAHNYQKVNTPPTDRPFYGWWTVSQNPEREEMILELIWLSFIIAVERCQAKWWIHCRSEAFEMLVTPYAKWTIEIPFDLRCHKNERLWIDEIAEKDFGKCTWTWPSFASVFRMPQWR